MAIHSSIDSSPCNSLAIAVTCFDSGDNALRLKEISKDWSKLANKVKVFIITNNAANNDIAEFCSEDLGFEVRIIEPNYIGHPYLLTWIHREIFLEEFKQDDELSHFLYLEDDILFTLSNLEYFLEGISVLKPLTLIPGFLRFEVGRSGARFAVDVLRPDAVLGLPRLRASEDYWWVNMRFVYQGLYLLDRELFEEFVYSEAFGPDVGHWRIRERATQGLILQDVPYGCFSRNFVGYSVSQGLDSRALVHHVSDRYIHDPTSRFSTLPVSDVLQFRKRKMSEKFRSLKESVRLSREELVPRPVFNLGDSLKGAEPD